MLKKLTASFLTFALGLSLFATPLAAANDSVVDINMNFADNELAEFIYNLGIDSYFSSIPKQYRTGKEEAAKTYFQTIFNNATAIDVVATEAEASYGVTLLKEGSYQTVLDAAIELYGSEAYDTESGLMSIVAFNQYVIFTEEAVLYYEPGADNEAPTAEELNEWLTEYLATERNDEALLRLSLTDRFWSLANESFADLLLGEESASSELPITSMEFTVTQPETNSFIMQSISELAESGVTMYAESTQEPKYVDQLTGTNTLVYSEFYNLAGLLENSLNTFSVTDEMIEEIFGELYAYKNLISSHTALQFRLPESEDTTPRLPYMTLVSEITEAEDNTILVSAIVDVIDNSMAEFAEEIEWSIDHYCRDFEPSEMSAETTTDPAFASKAKCMEEYNGIDYDSETFDADLDAKYFSNSIETATSNTNNVFSFSIPTEIIIEQLDEDEKVLAETLIANSQFQLSYGLFGNEFIISSDPTIVEQLSTETTDNNVASLLAENDITYNEDTISVIYTDLEPAQSPVNEFISQLMITSDFNGIDSEELAVVNDLVAGFTSIKLTGESNLNGSTLTETNNLTIDWQKLVSGFEGILYEELVDEITGYNYYSLDSYSDYQQSQLFPDTDSNQWYSKHVGDLLQKNIVNSDQPAYRPGDSITRAEFTALIMRSLPESTSVSAVTGADIFSDINPADWYSEVIGQAFSNDIIKGDDGSDRFRPNDPISRAEAVKIITNAYPELLEYYNNYTLGYDDVESNSWYFESVISLTFIEVVEGVEYGIFKPEQNLNRAEAAALINRMLLYFEQRAQVNPWSAL